MTAAAVDTPWSQDDDLLSVWQKLDLPKHWRSEIIFDGSITVTPPPMKPHVLIASMLHEALVAARPADAMVIQSLGVRLGSFERVYIPDVLVAPSDALRGDGYWIQSEELLLVVEITSKSNADHDRKWKRRGYAEGQVPLYLLVDRWSRPAALTLFSEPVDGEFQQSIVVPFGEALALPAPFDVEIDSSRFPAGTE